MKIRTTSDFPSKIDKMYFYEDYTYSDIETMNEFNRLLDNGYIDKANDLLDDNGITNIDANYFNMMENRIATTQEYTKAHEKDITEKPITAYGEEPKFRTLNMIWVTDL